MNKSDEFKQLSEISKNVISEHGFVYFLKQVWKKIIRNNVYRQKTIKLALSSLDEKQEKILESNMVWVMGSTRSGSTWLCKQLLNNFGNIIWDEPNIGMNLDSISRKNNNIILKKRQTYFFSEHFKNNCWLPALRKMIIARTYMQTGTLTKKIIIKEPESYAADLIMECFPNSKLIFLLRDGRDVVDSWLDAHKKDSWEPNRKPLENEETRLKKVKEYSNVWVRFTKVVTNAYQNHDPKLRFFIKYEELLKDTKNQLKKVYDFLEIPATGDEISKIVDKFDFKKIPSDQKGSAKITRTASPGSWKNNLTQNEQNVMHSIMNETLKEKGYVN